MKASQPPDENTTEVLLIIMERLMHEFPDIATVIDEHDKADPDAVCGPSPQLFDCLGLVSGISMDRLRTMMGAVVKSRSSAYVLM